jgi:hypothetical protein
LVGPFYFTAYGIRCALEEENSREVANCNVSVASEWILQCGLQFFGGIRNTESRGEDEDMVLKAGSL